MKNKRKFQVGDEVMSRGVCDMWSRAVIEESLGNGYYTVREKSGFASKHPYMQYASNLRKA